MLRITVNKSASAAKKYYSEMYYSEGRDILSYYEEKEQAIGTWHGQAAEQLGLSGGINKDDFGLLCDNINPLNNKQLTERNNLERRVGYDFTFNASKSVSLAYTFATNEEKKQILGAFQQSVKEAMQEVENGIQSRVRKAGQNQNRDTSNIIYGEFVHFTGRPIDGVPDPHLHAHCFVFNATYDKTEETWKAAQFGQVKKDAPYYEAVFHSSLADKLSNIGYDIERTKNGFEIKGIDRNTIDKFSRRTEEIEHVAKENNITDL
ncbi:MAG: conjugative relaxase, partial [Flavobacterium sp.]